LPFIWCEGGGTVWIGEYGEPTGHPFSATAELATHHLQVRDAIAEILLHPLAAPVDEVDYPELVGFGLVARVVALRVDAARVLLG